MPADPQLNAPLNPKEPSAMGYPPQASPGDPLMAFGNSDYKGTIPFGNRPVDSHVGSKFGPHPSVKPQDLIAYPNRFLPGQSIKPRPLPAPLALPPK